MYKQLKNAFTLTEVLVATFIWTIILWFIFVFLGDIMNNISESKKEIIVLSNYLDFSNKLNNYVDVYNTGTILIDNAEDVWTDLFIMKSPSWDSGLLLWVVNLINYQLDLDNTSYKNTWLWFRYLSSQELQDIEASSGSIVVYWYLFQKDKVYDELNIKDMQINLYNWWYIHEINLSINIDYKSWLQWVLWKNIPESTLIKFNLDF